MTGYSALPVLRMTVFPSCRGIAMRFGTHLSMLGWHAGKGLSSLSKHKLNPPGRCTTKKVSHDGRPPYWFSLATIVSRFLESDVTLCIALRGMH